MAKEKKFRRGVGVVLLNSDNLIFAGRRLGMEVEAWQMPQGGIDGSELPQDAALRELNEEIGTNNAKILGATSDWLTYEFPAYVSKKVWQGRYMGQRQKWYAMKFLGCDEDIVLDRSSHPEFNDWKWVSPAEMLDLIVTFKKNLYIEVFNEFKEILEL